MDYVTFEPIEAFSQFFIPIILLAIGSYVTAYITIHLKRQEKTKYIKILRSNFPIIDAYLTVMRDYKSQSIATIPLFLAMGIFLGVLVGGILQTQLSKPFIYIILKLIEINDIGEHIYSFLDNLELLDARLIYFSFLHIFNFIIIFFIWVLWIRFIRSKNIDLPQIRWHNSKNQNKILFPSISPKTEVVYKINWIFIGIVLGIYFALIITFILTMKELSIISNQFSYNLTSFKTFYLNLDAKTAYFIKYKIIFLIGLVGVFVVMLRAFLYNVIFFNEVKRLFTNYFLSMTSPK